MSVVKHLFYHPLVEVSKFQDTPVSEREYRLRSSFAIRDVHVNVRLPVWEVVTPPGIRLKRKLRHIRCGQFTHHFGAFIQYTDSIGSLRVIAMEDNIPHLTTFFWLEVWLPPFQIGNRSCLCWRCPENTCNTKKANDFPHVFLLCI